jgi:hypothetical protein
MTTLFAIIIGFAIFYVITYNWVKGIEYMQKNHPDYKGEDFLGEDEDTK